VQVAEEEEDQDDRQRNADEPQKTTLHHGENLQFVVWRTTCGAGSGSMLKLRMAEASPAVAGYRPAR
jgi:hypothetical protein